MVKQEVDDFFSIVEEKFDYRGHITHPEMKDEVQEINKKGVSVPVAAFLVCEKKGCKLNYKKLIKEKGFKKLLSGAAIVEGREITGMPRPGSLEICIFSRKKKNIFG